MAYPSLNPELHRELFRITDDVRRLKLNPQSLTVEEHKDLLVSVCNALKTSIDNGLPDAPRLAADLGANQHIKDEANAILRDTGAFTAFIDFEIKSLTACGVNKETALDITNEITALRDKLAQPHFNPDEVQTHLQQGTAAICLASQTTSKAVSNDQKNYEQN